MAKFVIKRTAIRRSAYIYTLDLDRLQNYKTSAMILVTIEIEKQKIRKDKDS